MKRHLYNTVLLLVLSAFSINAYSQAYVTDSLRIDSLKRVLLTQKEDTNKVNTLNALSSNFFYIGDNKNALEKAQNALTLSEKLNFINGKAASLLGIGAFYEYKGEQPEARKNYDKAIEYYIATGNKNGVANAYISIVSSYNEEGDLPHALENIYKALNIYEETSDKNGLAGTYLMLGANFSQQNNYSEALKNYFLALAIIENLGDRNFIATVNAMIAQVYFNQGNFEEALKRDSLALKYYDASANKINFAATLRNIGSIYEKLGRIAYRKGDSNTAKTKFAHSLENYFSAINIYKKANAEWIAYDTYIDVGKVYIQLNDLSKAKSYLQESLSFFKNGNDHSTLENVYKALSDLDSASGNFSQAYQDYKESIAQHDSSNIEESNKKMQQVTMQYQFDKRKVLPG